MADNIVVIAEHSGGKIAPVTYEAINFARRLQELTPGTLRAVVLGQDAQSIASELAASGRLDVLAVGVAGLADYNGEAYGQALPGVINRLDARWVVLTASSQGLDCGPGLAVALGAACIGPVRGLEQTTEGLVFQREVFGGKLLQHQRSLRDTGLLLVQPGFFSRQPPTDRPAGVVELMTVDITEGRTRNAPVDGQVAAGSSLAEAEVIVAAGRGVGKPENLEPIRRLAALFPRSAVAGSRPVCDDGWLEYRQQVGVTGQTVCPKLYIACGISGASQHVAGMQGSGFIVAISNDPQAAIFNVADVCVVEDLGVFVPELIARLQSLDH